MTFFEATRHLAYVSGVDLRKIQRLKGGQEDPKPNTFVLPHLQVLGRTCSTPWDHRLLS